MKVVLVTLLLLVCSTQVLTLTCFVCADANDTICMEEFPCPDGSNYCVTVEQGGVISSRTCEPTCPDTPYTNCCTEDLC
ncbi:three-finger toxin A2-like [Takifugu rubripes]|uniref:three-finger toxin A2-like n=1 Tax=Takifugu rubripes TaxID=31033 RepID=UPI0005D191B3|nr:three-finger toxin A2-like [Takifugu rubripes]|eukprot:XP_011616906.1 PREDICTED: three-finger toxin A2-like [Takifugu rubripes]